MKSFTLEEIAARVGGTVTGDSSLVVTGVAPLSSAADGDISFVASNKFLRDYEASGASAVLVGPEFENPRDLPVIRVAQPTVRWVDIVEMFFPPVRRIHDIHPSVVVGKDCEIADGVGIGAGVVLGDRVKIGANSEIFPGVTIGDDSSLGEDSLLYSGVHVYHECSLGARVIVHSGTVIGGDGYGFVQEQIDDPNEPVRHRKVPQVGGVIVEDDVEIGSNVTIDRGALESTVIGRGTKIDNLVMVAHNCRVGPHCLLIGQSGLSGSVEAGPYVTVAGQSGVAGHLKLGARAVIAGRTGIMKDVGPGELLMGSPALPGSLARRAYAQIEHLPEFRRTIQDLEKRVKELEGESED